MEVLSSDFNDVNEADVKSLFCQPKKIGMLEINTSISLKKVKEVIDELGYGTRATRENV